MNREIEIGYCPLTAMVAADMLTIAKLSHTTCTNDIYNCNGWKYGFYVLKFVKTKHVAKPNQSLSYRLIFYKYSMTSIC